MLDDVSRGCANNVTYEIVYIGHRGCFVCPRESPRPRGYNVCLAFRILFRHCTLSVVLQYTDPDYNRRRLHTGSKRRFCGLRRHGDSKTRRLIIGRLPRAAESSKLSAKYWASFAFTRVAGLQIYDGDE